MHGRTHIFFFFRCCHPFLQIVCSLNTGSFCKQTNKNLTECQQILYNNLLSGFFLLLLLALLHSNSASLVLPFHTRRIEGSNFLDRDSSDTTTRTAERDGINKNKTTATSRLFWKHSSQSTFDKSVLQVACGEVDETTVCYLNHWDA